MPTLPTAANTAVVFLDLQTEIIKNSITVKGKRVARAAAIVAKLAALHEIPAFLSAVPPGGDYIADVLEPLGNPAPSMRTQTTAFADESIVSALSASGRKVLLLAGVASEIVVQHTALDAIAAGYEVYVIADACGGVSERTENAAWQRVTQAGAALLSVVSLAGELAGDFQTELGGKTLALMYESMGRS